MLNIKYFLIFIISVSFCGCSVAELDRKLGEVFFNQDGSGPKDSDDLPAAADAAALTKEQKEKIEAWLVGRGLNRFGDPEGTWYESGTPLVTASGTVERYEYILGKHQELSDILR